MPKLCKFNLHLLACRLHAQEKERGHVYHDTEMWVERMMQRCKRRTRYKSPKAPEKVMAMHICEELATQRLQGDNPGFQTFDGLVPGYRGSPDTGEQFDVDEGGTYLLHKGKRANASGVPNGDCWMHTACFLKGSEIVKGTSHGRAYSRDSSYVKIEMNAQPTTRRRRRGSTGDAIARVRHFLRVCGGGATQRFAVMDVFLDCERLQDHDLGEMFKIQEGGGTQMTLAVETIKHKLLVAKPNNQETYCLKYFFMSAAN